MGNYEIALDYFNQKMYKEALQYFLCSLAEDLNGSFSYYNLALTYEMLGENELAIAFYNKAISIDNNIRAINNLAVLKFSLEQIEDALELLDTAITSNPDDAEAYSQLGNYHMNNENFDFAEKYLLKAQKLDCDFFYNYFSLAKLYIKLNDVTKAKENLCKCLEINPDFQLAKIELEKLT